MKRRRNLRCKLMRIREESLVAYVLLLIAMPIIYFALSKSPFFKTNDDSARYMVSSIIQSKAAIVAVVVTLSLVAVQLTASYYSQSVTDLFRNSPHLAILTSVYVSTMVFDIIILKTIGEFSSPWMRDVLINLVCVFGIYCLMILLPYLYATLELLRPSTIVGSLLNDITMENFLKKDDSFEGILKILEVSGNRSDYQGLRSSLEKIGKEMQLMLIEPFNPGEEEIIAKRFSSEIRKICFLLTRYQGFFTRITAFLSEMIRFALELELNELITRLMYIFNDLIDYNYANPEPEITVTEISEVVNIILVADTKNSLGVAKGAISSLKKIALLSLKKSKHGPPTLDTLQMHIFVIEIRQMLIKIKKTVKNREIYNFIATTIEEIPDLS